MPISFSWSQSTLLASFTGHLALSRILLGPNPNNTRYARSLKIVSTFHSTLTTLLAVYALRRQKWTLSSSYPASAPLSNRQLTQNGFLDDANNPLITTRSEFLNSITALEAGYLIQDTLWLLRQPRSDGGGKHELDKTLLTHHLLIGPALLVLHYYIGRGWEKGVYIIVRLLLMNASTPILNLRWFLRQNARDRKKLILSADIAFALAFFYARIWLIFCILAEYGKWHGWSAWRVFWQGLRTPCQMGTGALGLANIGWWTMMVWNIFGRSKFILGGE